ncbi:MAG: DUF3027 domain-containing protein [Actinobacteria bacterium]|nr:DUF3027 domain-containing protein [Actinomycetota bacterium]MCB9411813.1 DUF3027 domain-containing protein [Actinomycetota bacterium]
MTLTLDPVAGRAIDIAEAAVRAEAGPDAVGAHLGAEAEDKRLVTHLFECTDPAYRGWRWAVTLARAPKSRTPTVDDVVLVPGPESIVAPQWVPFGERLRPDDLGVGDVIPADPDDERLVPGYSGGDEDSGDDLLQPPWWEPGLGRPRVLSALGRDEAAQRWRSGERGPSAPMAKHATSTCSTCGWLLHLGGPMGLAFGVCANAMSPADARVVTLDYGCGAHSENMVVVSGSTSDVVLDELGYELVTFVVPDAELDEDEDDPEEET